MLTQTLGNRNFLAAWIIYGTHSIKNNWSWRELHFRSVCRSNR